MAGNILVESQKISNKPSKNQQSWRVIIIVENCSIDLLSFGTIIKVTSFVVLPLRLRSDNFVSALVPLIRFVALSPIDDWSYFHLLLIEAFCYNQICVCGCATSIFKISNQWCIVLACQHCGDT